MNDNHYIIIIDSVIISLYEWLIIVMMNDIIVVMIIIISLSLLLRAQAWPTSNDLHECQKHSPRPPLRPEKLQNVNLDLQSRCLLGWFYFSRQLSSLSGRTLPDYSIRVDITVLNLPGIQSAVYGPFLRCQRLSKGLWPDNTSESSSARSALWYGNSWTNKWAISVCRSDMFLYVLMSDSINKSFNTEEPSDPVCGEASTQKFQVSWLEDDHESAKLFKVSLKWVSAWISESKMLLKSSESP